MTPDAGAGPPGPRLPSRPVSRPPRLRPTTRPGPRRPAGGPGAVLRALSGALLAVAAVALGVVVLLALRGPGGEDDTLLTTGSGALRERGGSESAPPVPPDPTPEAEPAPETEPGPEVEPGPVAEPGAQAESAPEAEPPPPPVPGDVTVTVLGVGGPEVAEPTAARLREEGWTVRLVASYRGAPPGATTLFHVEGHEAAAELLAASAGAAAVRPAPSTLSESDLTLVVAG